jgi:hypothetical protein
VNDLWSAITLGFILAITWGTTLPAIIFIVATQ